MRTRSMLLLAGGTAGLAALWLVWQPMNDADRGSARDEIPARASAPPAPAERPAPAARDALPALPASLRGTEPDGALVRDADGRFVPTRDALDLFDYYLSATGEETDAEIRARIEAAIRARLDDPAPALTLLDHYLAYRAKVRELFADPFTASLPLERRLQRIRELRRSHFGAEIAEALFAEEEARWRVDVERLQVLHDPALDEDERADRLAALDAELPAPVREARALATAALTLRRDEAHLRAEGASDAEIDALRESRFGPEAAARLSALDQQRAEWNARVDAYRAERDRVIAEQPDDPEAQAAAIDALRDERFSGPERRRIEALDRLEARAETAETKGTDPAL